MGRKRILGLDWLELENTSQRLWAVDYLRAKGFDDLFPCRKKRPLDELPSYKEMLAAGMDIERKQAARELFGDMKSAWRQEKDRQKKKDSGRQVCAFTLDTIIKANLQVMAKEQNKSATALLESLITKAYSAHLRRQQKQHSKHSSPTARNYSFQGPNNIRRDKNERQKTAQNETASHLDAAQKVEHEVSSAAEEIDAHSLKPLPAAEKPQKHKWTRTPKLPPPDSQAAEMQSTEEPLAEQSATADQPPVRENNDGSTPGQDVIGLPLENLKFHKKKPFVMPNELVRLLRPGTD